MPLTREALERLAGAVGQTVTLHEPGEVVEDVDGWPIYMTPNTTTTGALGAVIITADEADQLGICEGDIPGVRIL